MLLHLESLRDFAILQTIRNQSNNLFFAARQQWHAVGVVELNWFGVDQCGQNMFNIFVAGPDLSAMDGLDTFGERFQRVRAIEDSPGSVTKGVNDAFRLGRTPDRHLDISSDQFGVLNLP